MRRPMSTSITRPADTTAYAAGDVIGTASSHVMTFLNDPYGAEDVNNLVVLRAWLTSSAAPATLPSLELWLFDTAPAAQADNAAFAVTDAEILNLVGVMPFETSYVGLASGNHAQIASARTVDVQIKPDATAIYGVLVVRNAYTPISGEVFKVKLDVV